MMKLPVLEAVAMFLISEKRVVLYLDYIKTMTNLPISIKPITYLHQKKFIPAKRIRK